MAACATNEPRGSTVPQSMNGEQRSHLPDSMTARPKQTGDSLGAYSLSPNVAWTTPTTGVPPGHT